MTTRLTPAQRTYLLSEPVPAGHNRIRRAIDLLGSNQTAIAGVAGIRFQQFSRYVNGADLLLSTAMRISAVFGLEVTDLWPTPPSGRIIRRTARTKPARKNGHAKRTSKARDPKAVAA